MTRTPRLLALAALAAVLVSCHIEEPFVRDNHWDVGGNGVKTLTGPDSTFSIGDHISVTLFADPPIPVGLSSITWESSGAADTATQVFSSGAGEFVVGRAHAEFQLVAVTAQFDDVIVAWTVTVGQKLANLDLYCGTLAAQIACDATPLAVNATRLVSTITSDANTNALRRSIRMMARMTAISRDPAVLAVVPALPTSTIAYTVRGVAAGATWLVVSGDGVRDSVRVVVGP